MFSSTLVALSNSLGLACLPLSVLALSDDILSTQALFNVPAFGANQGESTQTWNYPPSREAPHNLVFNAIDSVLNSWASKLYRNGHAFFPATIPRGTVLYHGKDAHAQPTGPEWLAFDPEHSYMFSTFSSRSWLLTYEVNDALKMGMFDGSSAAKMDGGSMDLQDMLIWGWTIEENLGSRENERIEQLCQWGEELGLDGFIRLEVSYEIMLCDFTKKLRVVSQSKLTPSNIADVVPQPVPPTFESTSLAENISEGRLPPPGWIGSFRSLPSVITEALLAGQWHTPESRVKVDMSRYVTFLNPKFTSVTTYRKENPSRLGFRIGNATAEEISTFKSDVVTALQAAPDAASGIDWRSISRVIVERFSDRIERLNHTLSRVDDGSINASTAASSARSQLQVMLMPYLLTHAVPSNDSSASPDADIAWAKPIHEMCSTTLIPRLGDDALESEVFLRDSIHGVTKEICRVVTLLWTSAYDIEFQPVPVVESRVSRWGRQVRELMTWLGWASWVRCRPACSDDSFCYLPTWSASPDAELASMEPKCMRWDHS
ncbi:hypothetical protein SISNIDRAFT_457673 [Sistotremastrum niveocremeum HHB9708]|uniref:Uncharacterized protein n=1 Tax=Sistotremastrum niveocremeum HHB9708 TaxID=1314777 RepID=A0A164RFS6_9AGAM|nr:hypothetical protein SISNIDRAFT_457673 [Sistotremastrum niveocremeum HHB9708]